jgi:hypothetical protein
MVIVINYYNYTIQIPKGFFFCTNGDLGGGGCQVCFCDFFGSILTPCVG